MKSLRILSLATAVVALPSASSLASVTLNDAYALYKFDAADNGAAAAGQIVDSSGNSRDAVNAERLNWTSVPATGPAGGITIDPPARGLSFDPTVATLNPGTAVNDAINAAGFRAPGSIGGSSAVVTRFRWDGPVPGSDDTNVGVYWMVSNSFNFANRQGWIFGIQDTAGTTGQLRTLFGNNNTTPPGSNPTDARSTFNLNEGEWYDVAMVIDDKGDATDGTGSVTFYLQGTTGGLQTSFVDDVFVTDAASTRDAFIIGTETQGTGTGNERKTINGVVDYLALFDQTLTQSEVQAIFTIPEPSRAVLLGLGGAMMLLRRRRR